MSEDRLITIAIHTYEKAVMLKTLLENEGVPVVLHNVNLIQPVVSSGVRVRIKEKDLPLALRIIENTDIFAHNDNIPNSRQKIIVPTDFSDHSLHAAIVAFNLAHELKASIIFLHSFIDPLLSGNAQLTNALSYDAEQEENHKRIEEDAYRQMHEFTSIIKGKIKKGKIPPVKFITDIREGVPEDVITEYSKQLMPMLIVMGTRDSERKEKELIGSVTAEVLDSCRFPVVSIPELSNIQCISAVQNILFFCNLDQDDILALDTLHRLLSFTQLHVTLVNIIDKKKDSAKHDSINALIEYCNKNFTNFTFSAETIKP